MTVLEKFLQFVEHLTVDHLNSIDAALATIMESHSGRYGLVDTEQQLVDQRFVKPKPEFSSSEDITKIFGKPFSA